LTAGERCLIRPRGAALARVDPPRDADRGLGGRIRCLLPPEAAALGDDPAAIAKTAALAQTVMHPHGEVQGDRTRQCLKIASNWSTSLKGAGT